MIFVKSPPWAFKLVILVGNIIKQTSEPKSSLQFTMKVFLFASLYTITSLIPSLLCAVRNRKLTTEYTQMTLLIISNVYMLLCTGLHDSTAAKHMPVTLQFILLHVFYSQNVFIGSKPHAIHFSAIYRHVNTAMAVVSVTSLGLRSKSMELEKHDAVLIITAMFTGEILGCLSYAQYVLIRLISELYESFIESVFVF
tara:strand:+ start:11663 stop:12253 length:591 start_codon:yes stop_codon:yes gene_type:complete